MIYDDVDHDDDDDGDDDDDEDAPYVLVVKRRLASWQPVLLRTTLYLSPLLAFTSVLVMMMMKMIMMMKMTKQKGFNIRLHDDGRKSGLQVKRGRG